MAMQATLSLTGAQLATAREWLVDLEFADTAHLNVQERREFFAERSDAAVTRCVARNYDGGLAAFVAEAEWL